MLKEGANLTLVVVPRICRVPHPMHSMYSEFIVVVESSLVAGNKEAIYYCNKDLDSDSHSREVEHDAIVFSAARPKKDSSLPLSVLQSSSCKVHFQTNRFIVWFWFSDSRHLFGQHCTFLIPIGSENRGLVVLRSYSGSSANANPWLKR